MGRRPDEQEGPVARPTGAITGMAARSAILTGVWPGPGSLKMGSVARAPLPCAQSVRPQKAPPPPAASYAENLSMKAPSMSKRLSAWAPARVI